MSRGFAVAVGKHDVGAIQVTVGLPARMDRPFADSLVERGTHELIGSGCPSAVSHQYGTVRAADLCGSGGRLGVNLSRLPTLAPMIEAIKAVDPQKAKILQDFLVQLELFSSERVLLLGPGSTTLIR